MGFGRMELLLVLSLIALIFQVFPAAWFNTLWAIDVRNWTRGVWMGVNVSVVLTLIGIRFIPELFVDWRERRARLATEREKHAKRQELLDQRKVFERMQEARKRRLY